ncbi:Mov34/MPN/PAD-1 family protein [Falsibacillus pallidus]|uniref:Mov34/MPN/PAD-1 family protein n=1 Tax=Falsibacillus pallidus TaxID=493781 RepID=UPI003D9571D2
MKMSSDLFKHLVMYAGNDLPRESCGLLGGNGAEILSVIPLKNEAGTNRQFYVKEENVQAAFIRLNEIGHDLIAIYHSHPTSNPIPSQADIHFHPDESVKMAILSLKDKPQLKIFQIAGGQYFEIPYIIMD